VAQRLLRIDQRAAAPLVLERQWKSVTMTTKNMSETERWLSVMSGSLLAFHGLKRRDRAGVLLALLGTGLAMRGIQGYSGVYERLGMRRFAGAGGEGNVLSGMGVHVERSIIVRAPVDEVFRFWRNLENLPRFMAHLVSVREVMDGTYRWVAKAPVGTVAWDAEIIEERVPWMISWRSLPGSQIENAGSVHFTPAPSGGGTEVNVTLAYKPPAGVLGTMIARFRGEEPSVQIRDDLARFKQIVETGEVWEGSRPRPADEPRTVHETL
jgi:uncharacterized membrane protein